MAWPEGVKALAVMRREHDLHMLSKLDVKGIVTHLNKVAFSFLFAGT